MKLGTNIQRVSERWALLKRFWALITIVTDSADQQCAILYQNLKQSDKVKVICVQMCECYNGGGIHFDGVVSRLTCFSFCANRWHIDTRTEGNNTCIAQHSIRARKTRFFI